MINSIYHSSNFVIVLLYWTGKSVSYLVMEKLDIYNECLLHLAGFEPAVFFTERRIIRVDILYLIINISLTEPYVKLSLHTAPTYVVKI